MFKLLIFGGTTEGRRLAEFCVQKNIAADVSVATDYGASLLPDNIGVLSGRLDSAAMTELIQNNGYHAVVDATHPYAEEATDNIKAACKTADVSYYRLLRDKSELYGETAETLAEAVDMLNKCDSAVLSTLGSNSAEQLTGVRNFRERLWLRILPIDGMKERCVRLGFDEDKIICEKGPFSIGQNIGHIKKSGAQILLTKESGKTGGYVEKIEAVQKCGIRMLTVTRPDEKGLSYKETADMIVREAAAFTKGEQ